METLKKKKEGIFYLNYFHYLLFFNYEEMLDFKKIVQCLETLNFKNQLTCNPNKYVSALNNLEKVDKP